MRRANDDQVIVVAVERFKCEIRESDSRARRVGNESNRIAAYRAQHRAREPQVAQTGRAIVPKGRRDQRQRRALVRCIDSQKTAPIERAQRSRGHVRIVHAPRAQARIPEQRFTAAIPPLPVEARRNRISVARVDAVRARDYRIRFCKEFREPPHRAASPQVPIDVEYAQAYTNRAAIIGSIFTESIFPSPSRSDRLPRQRFDFLYPKSD